MQSELKNILYIDSTFPELGDYHPRNPDAARL